MGPRQPLGDDRGGKRRGTESEVDEFYNLIGNSSSLVKLLAQMLLINDREDTQCLDIGNLSLDTAHLGLNISSLRLNIGDLRLNIRYLSL